MRSVTAYLALVLPAAVCAAPVSSSTNNAKSLLNQFFCEINILIIDALEKESAATSYCSSFLAISPQTLTSTKTQTPSSVDVTVLVTTTGNAVTATTTSTLTTSTEVTSTQTETQTVTETITLTTSTSTLTCLNSAYTASAPVGTLLKRGSSVSKPTPIPDSWASDAISTACSCLSIPTPSTTTTVTKTLVPGTITVTSTDTLTPTAVVTETATYTATNTATESTTVTTTTTLTAYAVVTTIASNGIAYRKYTHSYDADLTASGFTSSAFKSLTPDFSGALQSLSFSTPNWPSGSTALTLSDRGGASFDASQAALLLQGFFIARQTGTYTLSSSASYIDNWGYLWTGDAAYSDWSDANTGFQASRTGAGYYGGSTTVDMSEGDAIPLTWLWANGGGVSQSYFVVTAPDGTVTTDSTGYFVQACDSSVFA
ncbi:GLEYA domain-containing protein [Xylariales sp. PMI_506]|nr:GLEYA domain-containing protein [Xylariales sp. PMI_506]